MTAIKKIQEKNQIEKRDIDVFSDIIFDSITRKDIQTDGQLNRKEKLIEILSSFTEQLMDLHVESSKQSRLALIDFIDKLNMQKELLALDKGESTIAEIKLAGRRLGKKSQSAFEKK